jgi:hypothetical protein
MAFQLPPRSRVEGFENIFEAGEAKRSPAPMFLLQIRRQRVWKDRHRTGHGTDDALICALVPICHLHVREAVQRPPAASAAVDEIDPTAGVHHVVFVIAEEPMLAMPHDLRQRAHWPGYDRRPGGQGFDERKPERLFPVDRHQQRDRMFQQRNLLFLARLTEPVDEWMAEQWNYVGPVVIEVRRRDSGGDLERHPTPDRHTDGGGQILFWRTAADEHEMSTIA